MNKYRCNVGEIDRAIWKLLKYVTIILTIVVYVETCPIFLLFLLVYLLKKRKHVSKNIMK